MIDKWPENPVAPAPIDDQEAMAIKAIQMGVANAGQQQMALKAIVQKMAGTYDVSFRPGGAEGSRLTDFAEGKRWVGQQILNALNRKFATQMETTDGRRTSPRAAGRRNPKPDRTDPGTG